MSKSMQQYTLISDVRRNHLESQRFFIHCILLDTLKITFKIDLKNPNALCGTPIFSIFMDS